MKKFHIADWMWVFSALYLALGLFNILFAWLGMICFVVPLLFALIPGNKRYCSRWCGRGQLFSLLGGKLKLSRSKPTPKFLRSAWFRYGFLTFFMTMFALMIAQTVQVFRGADLQQTVTLLWTFRLPWHWADYGLGMGWVRQFAFGFYSVMLTSTLLGLVLMVLYQPRSWCVMCPMGTMTQGICKLKHAREVSPDGRTGQAGRGTAQGAGQ